MPGAIYYAAVRVTVDMAVLFGCPAVADLDVDDGRWWSGAEKPRKGGFRFLDLEILRTPFWGGDKTSKSNRIVGRAWN